MPACGKLNTECGKSNEILGAVARDATLLNF